MFVHQLHTLSFTHYALAAEMTNRPPDARTLFTEDRKTEASARWHENISPNDVDGHHVDVASAKRSFNEFSRQMSGLTQRKSQDTMHGGPDVEKAAEEDAEPFDLREYLTSSNDANQAAGIKHKVYFVSFSQSSIFIQNFRTACWCYMGPLGSQGNRRC